MELVSEPFTGRKSGILGGTLTETHGGILYRMLPCRAGYGYIPPPGRDISISRPGEYIQNAVLQGGIWIYPAQQGDILDFSTYKIPRHSGKNAALCGGTKPVQLVNNVVNWEWSDLQIEYS